MAKRKTNKSAAIREMLEAHPGEPPRAIAERLAKEKKIKVSAQMVSTVKSQAKNGGTKKNRRTTKADTRSTGRKGDTRGNGARGNGQSKMHWPALQGMIELVVDYGVEKVEEMLDVVKRIRKAK